MFHTNMVLSFPKSPMAVGIVKFVSNRFYFKYGIGIIGIF